MRRILLIVALLASVSTVSRPAAAHACTNPVEIEPGKPATVTVGVGAEETAAVEVALEIPSGFELADVRDARGWTTRREGSTVRFLGGRIEPFGCAYFSLAGTAPKRATLAIPILVKGEDGKVTEYRSREAGDLYAAQLVFAGTEATDAGVSEEDEEGSSIGNYAVVLVVLALAAGAIWWTLRGGERYASRSRRRPPVGQQQRSVGRGRPPSATKRRKPRRK